MEPVRIPSSPPSPSPAASFVTRQALFLLALLSLIACGGGSGGDTATPILLAGEGRSYPQEPLSCATPDMRQWVEANMRDYYLFYDQVPSLNIGAYADLQALINDLKVLPYDHFSYITDAAASSALFDEGQLFGYGWRLVKTSPTDIQFGYVYPQSPLAAEDVQRGDFLLAINGVHPLDMTNAQWDGFLGSGDEVKTPTLTVRDDSGVTRTLSVTKTTFQLDTVLNASVIPVANGKVAYLAFTRFLETSNVELDAAFEYFKQEQASDLILDLRYNGGGRISVANRLASKIVGATAAGSVFAEISWNDKFSDRDQPYSLQVEDSALNLSRLIVLSSASTCSASEMIINGLKPFMQVVQIGETSCGKPYGSAPHEACGKAMNALQFRFVNANGLGDYFDGIPADCSASDDTNYALGDTQEGMLAAALSYITSGNCQSVFAADTISTLDNTSSRNSFAPPPPVSHDPLESEKIVY